VDLGGRVDAHPVEQGLLVAEVELGQLAQLLRLQRTVDLTVEDDAAVNRGDVDLGRRQQLMDRLAQPR
jgi:hypothetical protein